MDTKQALMIKILSCVGHTHVVRYYSPAKDDDSVAEADIDTIEKRRWTAFDNFKKELTMYGLQTFQMMVANGWKVNALALNTSKSIFASILLVFHYAKSIAKLHQRQKLFHWVKNANVEDLQKLNRH